MLDLEAFPTSKGKKLNRWKAGKNIPKGQCRTKKTNKQKKTELTTSFPHSQMVVTNTL